MIYTIFIVLRALRNLKLFWNKRVSYKQADQLNFKDIFRYAAKHGLLELEEAERWLIYRDNCNETAHDYGEGFANETLTLLPQFIIDAYRITEVIKQYG